MRPAGRISAFLLAAALCGCATAQDAPPVAVAPPAAPAAPGLLKNVDFEADPIARRDCPPAWWCSMHSDPKSFKVEVAKESHSRGRFLKVSRVKNEPWAIVTQTVKAAALKGRRLRLSASVYAEALDGKAGPFILLQGRSGVTISRERTLLERGPGWRRASVEIDVGESAEMVMFGLRMQGDGWVGFDDVEVVMLPKAGA
jgi:hypothetical protein